MTIGEVLIYNIPMKIDEPVAILGFGTEGQAALEFLKAEKVQNITVCDQNPDLELPKGVKGRMGKIAFDDLIDFNTIIRSPGVNISTSGIQEAVEAGCNVTSLTKLTMEAASDRVTAVTGTNGKTTTTVLLEKILGAHYGQRLIVGGNDREPVLKAALKHPKNPILMEVSSFQFVDLRTSPYIAAVLNITPNHLDWHESLEEYASAKKNILQHQSVNDWAVLNANNENSAKLIHATPAQQFWVGQKRGSNWAVWDDGYLRLCFDGKIENVIHFDQLNLKTHPDNLLFAAAIAKLHFVPVSTVEEQIKLFKGVEHRLEFVRTFKDIHFYNDSSSTSPESALAAMDQFIPPKLILLLGGSSKEADFSFLASEIAQNKVRVYLYGKEGQTIKEEILAAGGKELILDYDEAGDFKKIIKSAYKHAKPEDSIVLSPACASFDMFENAKDRGTQFKKIVNTL